METERQEEFRRLLIPEMTRQELEDRLVEYIGVTDELKEVLMKVKLLDDNVFYCRPPNLTYCKKEIYPDFDCDTCKWKGNDANISSGKALDWDKIIGGMSDMLEEEYKNMYGIPSQEFFHFLVCHMEEHHPQLMIKDEVTWGELDKRAMKHYGYESIIQWRATYHGILMEWLMKQPPSNARKIDWVEMIDRYVAEDGGFSPNENKVFAFLEKQPEFN